MKCPDEYEIENYLAGELRARRFTLVAKHVKECSMCSQTAERMRQESEILKTAINDKIVGDRLVDALKKRGELPS